MSFPSLRNISSFKQSIFNHIKLNNSVFFKQYSSVTDSNSFNASEKPKWTQNSIRLGAIARKRGITALWDEWGVRHPATVLQVKEMIRILNFFILKKNLFIRSE